jgi:hypothetical protein
MRKKTTDFSKLPESDVIVDEVMRRYKKGLGTNILVIGLSGTGKSSVSIREAELIAKEHKKNAKEIKITVVNDLVLLIETIRKSNLGDVVIPEEVSVLFPSRRSMSGENVAINKIFDTVRKKQLTIIANAPILGTIDSHMRSMGHIIIETQRIYKTQKVVVSKALKMQTNPRSGKTYFHRFQRKGREVHRIFTKMPNLEIWNKYESDKDKFMDELYKNLKYAQEVKSTKLNKEMNKNSTRESIETLTPNELVAHRKVRLEGKTYRKAAKEMGYKSQRSIFDLLKSLDYKTKISQKMENVDKPNEPR